MLEIIQTVDETILLWIQETVRQGWLNPLVEFYTTLGNGGLLWIVLSLALLCWRPTRKVGAAALLALLLGALCTNVVLKNLVQRPRPYTAVEGLIPLLTSGDPNSFPSGHTCAAFAAGLAWAGTCSARWARTVGPDCRGGQRRVHGPVPAVCGGPLPQRRAGGGGDRLPGRPGPGAAMGERAYTTVGADMIRPNRKPGPVCMLQAGPVVVRRGI